ncbi:hypothetical protein HDU84_003492 [Entophlyctis sp. JEL0112]|nr:hypothetical protein HDU84_003492 [Entophlyctis sp. JEL0112]
MSASIAGSDCITLMKPVTIMMASADMTPDDCMNQCEIDEFALIGPSPDSSTFLCTCKSTKPSKVVPSIMCDMTCPSTDMLCGGLSFSNTTLWTMYEAAVPTAATTVTVSTASKSSISRTVTATSTGMFVSMPDSAPSTTSNAAAGMQSFQQYGLGVIGGIVALLILGFLCVCGSLGHRRKRDAASSNRKKALAGYQTGARKPVPEKSRRRFEEYMEYEVENHSHSLHASVTPLKLEALTAFVEPMTAAKPWDAYTSRQRPQGTDPVVGVAPRSSSMDKPAPEPSAGPQYVSGSARTTRSPPSARKLGKMSVRGDSGSNWTDVLSWRPGVHPGSVAGSSGTRNKSQVSRSGGTTAGKHASSLYMDAIAHNNWVEAYMASARGARDASQRR